MGNFFTSNGIHIKLLSIFTHAMAAPTVTGRFLECLDHLVETGRVRSRRQFALDLEYHPQGISEMVSQRRDVPLEIIDRAVAKFLINPNYLFTGHGKKILDASNDDGLRVKCLSILTDSAGCEKIVHVPVPAQAGYAGQLDDPTFLADLPTYHLPDTQFNSGTYRSFEVAGHSMEPAFHPHDIIIGAYIEPKYWSQGFKPQDAFVIVTNEDVLIKRVINKLATEKHIVCISDNPEFEPYTIAGNEIREVWKVRMKITRHFERQESQGMDISIQLQKQATILQDLQQKLRNVRVS